MFSRLLLRCALVMLVLAAAHSVRAAFDLQFTFDPNAAFNATQRMLLTEALADAEDLWKSAITGYQPGISIMTFPVTVDSSTSVGLAQGGPSGFVTQGGFVLSTGGRLEVAPATIDNMVSWAGYPGHPNPPPQYLGVNYLDDILAHEIGHALGIGTLWVNNGVYLNNTFQYTGQYGVAAYRQEFDPNADFVPVENAGGTGTPNSHWNQLMRSSTQEGDPVYPNYWFLDPRVGITDSQGRDFALELMTGALDPDYGEPFLSLTTIYSLRDLGFTTVPEPATLGLVVLSVGICATGMRRERAATS